MIYPFYKQKRPVKSIHTDFRVNSLQDVLLFTSSAIMSMMFFLMFKLPVFFSMIRQFLHQIIFHTKGRLHVHRQLLLSARVHNTDPFFLSYRIVFQKEFPRIVRSLMLISTVGVK